MLRTSERIQELEATLRGTQRILTSVSMTGQRLCLERDSLLELLRKFRIQYTHRDGRYCICCRNPEIYGCKPDCEINNVLKEK